MTPSKCMTSGMMSAQTVEWETPDRLFRGLDDLFHFDLDVCATPENAKCARFYSPKENGLHQTWRGTCWMNPPYGKEIGKWVRAAYFSSCAGTTVVGLIPARTDTHWFHDWVLGRATVIFLRGRIYHLQKGEVIGRSPFPSLIAIWWPRRVMARADTMRAEER